MKGKKLLIIKKNCYVEGKAEKREKPENHIPLLKCGKLKIYIYIYVYIPGKRKHSTAGGTGPRVSQWWMGDGKEVWKISICGSRYDTICPVRLGLFVSKLTWPQCEHLSISHTFTTPTGIWAQRTWLAGGQIIWFAHVDILGCHFICCGRWRLFFSLGWLFFLSQFPSRLFSDVLFAGKLNGISNN